jgi:hypothetical protein
MTTKRIVLIVGGVVVVLALIVVCFAAGIVGFALYQIGNSQAATKAKDFLRQNEKIQVETGKIEDFGSIVTGSINLHSGSGEATINLKVIGERSTVNAKVDLVLVSGGTWRVSAASYVNGAGQTINLLNPYESKILIPRLIA